MPTSQSAQAARPALARPSQTSQMAQRATFTTVRTEGALIPADLLARIAAGDPDLGGLAPADYHLSGERINEAANRAWNRAVGAWEAFKVARARWSAGDPGTTDTRERWLLPLFQELGYGRLLAARAVERDGQSYPISHLWGHVPIHLVGAGVDLDHRTAGVAGAARVSPHGLVQSLLSGADGAYLWGFVANGTRLRVLRDSARLARPAYVEFDLEAMMEGEAYADFVLLWLLCHESRVEGERPAECWLERWARAAERQGTRALDQLRDGVQRAIEALGRGFLAHPANAELRRRLRAGELDTQQYYRELLRVVYRLLFLFAAEDRDLLLDPGAALAARELYAKYYSTQRLRRLAGRLRGGRHADLYAMLRLVLRALGDDRGCPDLALPALGGFLFATGAASATPALDDCALANQDLLDAVRALACFTDRSTRRVVDYKNLGAEELGSVYEALLELRPDLHLDTGQFALGAARGNERKTTGSYYTPTGLVAELITSALDPVLEAAARSADPEAAILRLRVCDPASGSGHFLLAAAHRIARRLGQVRTRDDEPAPPALRAALRDVIAHCVYGVDVNPMAVELCKVSLWMEAVEPGKPLNFLDHHIKCGNSLLGATRASLADGVPDDAFDPVAGDDKAVARELKRRNAREREGQLKLPFPADAPRLGNLADDYRRLTAMPEDTPAEIHAKQREYERLAGVEYYDNARLYADAWCAAYFWPLDAGHQADAPTHGELRRTEQSPWSASIFLKQEVRRIASDQRIFHWHLEFPDVFDGGEGEGFDCVLGNPPWEQVELKEEEFFEARDPDVIAGHTGAERKRRIEALETSDPELYRLYVAARMAVDRERKFLQTSGRYPLTGRGRTNLYSVFAENTRGRIAPRGRAGIIVPTGIATDDTNKAFFGDMVAKRALASLYDFENRDGIFPGVHRSYKFSLLTLTGDGHGPERADLVCFALQPEDLLDPERHFTLSPADFALINPNTRTLPIFRSRRDAELTQRMYRAAPVLVDERGTEPVSPWGITFRQGLFNMTSDSSLFRTRAQLEAADYALGGDGVFRAGGHEDYVPLYEAKLFHQFDHRFATFEGGPADDKARDTTPAEHADPAYTPLPRYWVPRAEVERALGEWPAPWIMGYRKIARSTDERTEILSTLPRSAAGDSVCLALPQATLGSLAMALAANLNCIALDYALRNKLGGTNVSFFILKQLPVLPPETYDRRINGERLADWVTRRALELTYTSHDMAPLARDLGYDGPPYRWDEGRRSQLRGELDGLYAHLYGLTRDDFAYILTTFPVLRKNEERDHGEYRTARLALAAYDALAGEMAGGGAHAE